MKLKKGLKLRKLGKKYMIVRSVEGSSDLTEVFTLNESAAFLWEKIGSSDFTAQTLEGLLIGQYGISEETAKADVGKLIESWKSYSLVIE